MSLRHLRECEHPMCFACRGLFEREVARWRVRAQRAERLLEQVRRSSTRRNMEAMPYGMSEAIDAALVLAGKDDLAEGEKNDSSTDTL